MARAAIRPMVLAAMAGITLLGCTEGTGPFARKDAGGAPAVARSQTSTRLVERDVEAPQVFQANDTALWDGRPSLGGVWVASPDAVDPERVILRNPANGKFVIGALFRRELLNPGPKLQISSDAAAALDILAGQPVTLSVTALRREEVSDEPTEAAVATGPILDTAETVETTTLAATAGAAIARAEATDVPAAPVTPVVAPAAAAAAAGAATKAGPTATPAAIAAATAGAAQASGAAGTPATVQKASVSPATSAPASRALVQIGIFSVKANAERAAKAAGAAAPTRVLQEESQGKTFWRVVAGPAAAPSAREEMLAKVKAAGFGDAYYVSR